MLDCQACGACCRDLAARGTGICFLSEEEVARLPTRYVRAVTIAGIAPDPMLAADAAGRCLALRGTIGVKVRCSVYEDRPSACSSFRPGGRGCMEARREAGLEPEVDQKSLVR